MLQSTGSQRAGHDLATEQQQHDMLSSGIWDKQAQNQGVFVKYDKVYVKSM